MLLEIGFIFFLVLSLSFFLLFLSFFLSLLFFNMECYNIIYVTNFPLLEIQIVCPHFFVCYKQLSNEHLAFDSLLPHRKISKFLTLGIKLTWAHWFNWQVQSQLFGMYALMKGDELTWLIVLTTQHSQSNSGLTTSINFQCSMILMKRLNALRIFFAKNHPETKLTASARMKWKSWRNEMFLLGKNFTLTLNGMITDSQRSYMEALWGQGSYLCCPVLNT